MSTVYDFLMAHKLALRFLITTPADVQALIPNYSVSKVNWAKSRINGVVDAQKDNSLPIDKLKKHILKTPALADGLGLTQELKTKVEVAKQQNVKNAIIAKLDKSIFDILCENKEFRKQFDEFFHFQTIVCFTLAANGNAIQGWGEFFMALKDFESGIKFGSLYRDLFNQNVITFVYTLGQMSWDWHRNENTDLYLERIETFVIQLSKAIEYGELVSIWKKHVICCRDRCDMYVGDPDTLQREQAAYKLEQAYRRCCNLAELRALV